MILTITFLDKEALQNDDAWLFAPQLTQPKTIQLASEVIKIQTNNDQYELLNDQDTIVLEDGMQLATPTHQLTITLQNLAPSIVNNEIACDDTSLVQDVSLLPGVDSNSLFALFTEPEATSFSLAAVDSIVEQANLAFLETGSEKLFLENREHNNLETKPWHESIYEKNDSKN